MTLAIVRSDLEDERWTPLRVNVRKSCPVWTNSKSTNVRRRGTRHAPVRKTIGRSKSLASVHAMKIERPRMLSIHDEESARYARAHASADGVAAARSSTLTRGRIAARELARCRLAVCHGKRSSLSMGRAPTKTRKGRAIGTLGARRSPRKSAWGRRARSSSRDRTKVSRGTRASFPSKRSPRAPPCRHARRRVGGRRVKPATRRGRRVEHAGHHPREPREAQS